MLTRIHRKLGTAGFIVAIVALVAALGGGAYAASGGLSGKQKKEVEKIAKKYAGKPGAAGKDGASGPAGPAGASGKEGPAGKDGSNGANGTSVTGTPVAAGQEGCAAGGVKYTSASGNNVVCNGKNGTNGTTGFTETLPGGETETGAWAFGSVGEGGVQGVRVALSFPIPLAAELGAGKVHLINPAGKELVGFPATEQPSTACTGTAAEPTADPGHLCVYTAELLAVNLASSALIGKTNQSPGSATGASKTGAIVAFLQAAEGAVGQGSWAVTAEEE